ncbi:hypothetical protein P7C73_g242, partial [Tremellales sp. Uapishka_1]
MSRALSSHRKSQSTSALAVLASAGPSHPQSKQPKQQQQRPSRMSRSGVLASVEESASMASLPGLTSIGKEDKSPRKKNRREGSMTEEDLAGWLSDLRSLRSSTRRRLAALRGLERGLVSCCSHQGTITLERLIDHRVHTPLISLLTRHTQALTLRSSHSSIPSNDELALALLPELEILISILQGLCLLSCQCRDIVSEAWAIEMFIDLLLLLRTQPPSNSATPGEMDPIPTSHPIVYSILDLLFCILVDSPQNARTFEKLGGLEAVVRLLKGTGVVKEVRMKCIEFLYFYLLPEQSQPKRAVSSGSTSSSSSTESELYPASPLSNSVSPDTSAVLAPGKPYAPPSTAWTGLDMPFIPMTPRKPPKPSLGFLTPSTNRRISSSTSSTPSLAPVPASPHSPSSKRLPVILASSTPDRVVSSEWAKPTDINESIGLGLGLPRSSSRTSLSSSTSVRRVTPETPTFTDPFSTFSSGSGLSGSSTVIANPMSRSSTQPSLSIIASSPRRTVPRQSSVRRVSKSPLNQSVTPDTPASPGGPVTPQTNHMRSHSHLSAIDLPSKGLAPPHAETSRPHRAFPANLTRGLPSSASSPSLNSPLGASKRIPSERRMPERKSEEREKPVRRTSKEERRLEGLPSEKRVRSVDEKKEMLGEWLGNVDALVMGVEKVGFWGSVGRR